MIASLGREQQRRLEQNLFSMAADANLTKLGPFDQAECSLRGYTGDLEQVRRRRWGRHRIFFHGSHTDCHYHVFYLKRFKTDDREQEHDKAFKKRLRRALDVTEYRLLVSPEEETPRADTDTPDDNSHLD